MRISNRCKAIAMVTVIWSIWVLTDSQAASQTSDESTIASLKAMWDSQRSEIATAYIRYRSVSSGPSGLAPLNPQQVRDLVSQLAARSDTLKPIILKLHRLERRKQLEELEVPWSVKEFYSEGYKTREDTHELRGTDTQAFDGEQTVITNPANHQVDLFAPGQSRVVRTVLQQFRFVPMLPDGLAISLRRYDGQVVFEIPYSQQGHDRVDELAVDEATGLVSRFSTSDGKGQVFSEILQCDFVTYPGGIVFPTIAVRTKYRMGKLDDLVLCAVEEVRFNRDLPDHVFAITVPGGTNVFDRRRNQNSPLFVKTRTDVSDVADYLNKTTGVSAATHNNRSHWFTIVICLCLLVIAVALLVYRRMRGTVRL
jgi:hypothetical protein